MNRERRAVLRGIGALTGAVIGGAGVESAIAAGSGTDVSSRAQQIDTSLPPGVTLFDLNGDGEYTARVEPAPESMRDDAHPRPIHVTSDGNSTVDFAASVAKPSAGTTLGGLDRLSYDYYLGSADTESGDSGATTPGTTFVVVENGDGRHGMYRTVDAAGDGATEQWATVDVLARLRGNADATSQWFEYTTIEDGYRGQTFDDAVERFGGDARLVRVGVGRGNAVDPVTLDAYYDDLTVNDRTSRFPVSVAKRVSESAPFAHAVAPDASLGTGSTRGTVRDDATWATRQ